MRGALIEVKNQGAAMRDYELEVLEQYDIKVISTRKIRGAFFCDTNEGTMLLKETTISDRRALLLYLLLCHLESEGYTGVDTPVFTKERTLVGTSRDGNRYMLKKWYGGRECDVRREQDIVEAGRNLAVLHQHMWWQEPSEISGKEALGVEANGLSSENDIGLPVGDGKKMPNGIVPPAGRHLKEEFLCHTREMKKVRAYIRSRVSKGPFEYLFLEHFEKMYHLAMQVTSRLEESAYEELYRDSISEKRLIHGDYNYHNVLLPQAGTVTTNFDHFRMDVQVQDLYYFLRKVMEKHKWREELGDAVLDAYGRIRPLEERELEYIALKLAYPEKFWKTASMYYHSNKAWIPKKSVEKLQISIIQTEEKLRFLKNLFAFTL